MKRVIVVALCLTGCISRKFESEGAIAQQAGAQVTLTADQLADAERRLSAYENRLNRDGNNQRHMAGPYHLFHKAGDTVFGNVILFHGFSARTNQMAPLADFLFKQKFNVIIPSLPGHDRVSNIEGGTRYIPEVNFKSQYLQNIGENFAKLSDSDKAQAVDHFENGRLDPLLQMMQLNFNFKESRAALESPGSALYKKYFTEDYRAYIKEALDRVDDINSLPGPTYTFGLSVGGTVALRVAEERPQKIKGVVVAAPLLRIYDDDKRPNREKVMLTGPLSTLDKKQFGQSNNGISFLLGSYTGTEVFGLETIANGAKIKRANIPVFMILSESSFEDAASIVANKNFFSNVKVPGSVLHVYDKSMEVPHAMVDPDAGRMRERMYVNEYWKSMYKEVVRFYRDGKVNQNAMNTHAGAGDIQPEPENISHP